MLWHVGQARPGWPRSRGLSHITHSWALVWLPPKYGLAILLSGVSGLASLPGAARFGAEVCFTGVVVFELPSTC
jgi:hypothetical protein